MLEANRMVLDTFEQRVEGELDATAQIEGRVVIEPGARISDSVVRGPAIIGAGARHRDAYVGPYTSIGDRLLIERGEIEHSIVLENSSSSTSTAASRPA